MRRLIWLVPTLYILFLMLPIYWLVSMSFKPTNEILGGFSLWPQDLTFENYAVIVYLQDVEVVRGDKYV